jgi:23S rRNA pseudouridine2605 synthase
MALVRLQKILADAGVASRRVSEQMILDGRVSVDGNQIFELGSKFDPEISQVEVDGETLKMNKTKTYLAFYKPRGIISTMSDPDGRANLGDYFKTRNERLFHVGRLDRESEGLILLTNDGNLTHRATHPSYGMLKKYLVELEGAFTKENIEALLKGVILEDGMARALDVKIIREVNSKHHWVEVAIHEGRFHIIRRMFEFLEIEVLRLIRTDFGPISIGDTKEGRWRVLNSVEVDNLFIDLKLKP